MLKLPASVRVDAAPALWAGLQSSLRAEAAQIVNGAGAELNVDAGELQQFDSVVLTLLLSAARLCKELGVQLRVLNVPAKLQELARVYGVAELLWPESPEAGQGT
ncbi:STAS domain-containing protein [Roseateles albus]|uniref:STAS domain-containing protein n=1 Tax=Roseateles albus TaxID=2987525 RepID=A0ABT5KCE0_9BURK|nr:STAS domain-containing protein [Roseateles albus]MDC8771592.1 STAS domain-containing protein [Roseateles albus]